MSSFQRYGDPSTGQVAVRPSCWGSQYNSDSRECRNCGWSTTCREHIVQLNLSRQTSPAQAAPTPVQAAPAFPLAPYTSPVPMPTAPAPWVAPPQPPQVSQFRPAGPPPVTPVGPVSQPQAQRLPPHLPAPVPGGYGSIPDHMFNYIGAIPAPIRPQYEGETFTQRVVKNSILSGVEAVIGQMMLGVRQYRWYPEPAKPPAPPTLELPTLPGKG